jgi:hypothetical protein
MRPLVENLADLIEIRITVIVGEVLAAVPTDHPQAHAYCERGSGPDGRQDCFLWLDDLHLLFLLIRVQSSMEQKVV